MNTDTIYRVIRYFGIGLIFVSLLWAFYKGTGSESHPGGPCILTENMRKLCGTMKQVFESTQISYMRNGAGLER